MHTTAFVLGANVTWEPCGAANSGQACATGAGYAGSGIEPDT